MKKFFIVFIIFAILIGVGIWFIGKSNKKLMGLVLGTSALIAGSTKFWLLKFNRAGSKEFIVDENLYGKKKTRNSYQKYLAKQEKKKLKVQ